MASRLHNELRPPKSLSFSANWPSTQRTRAYPRYSSLGPSVYSTYACAFAHADDIHTVTSSLPSLQQQIHMVQKFAIENSLALDPAKCEVITMSLNQSQNHHRTSPRGMLQRTSVFSKNNLSLCFVCIVHCFVSFMLLCTFNTWSHSLVQGELDSPEVEVL